MWKLPLAIFFFLFSLTLTGVSFFLGQRLTTQKYAKTESLLEDKSLEAFCADFDCKTIGLKGTIADYGYASKKIDLLAKGTHFEVFLTDSVKVDDSYGTSYFEEKMRKGDVIYVVFDTTKSTQKLAATDVYIEKTGILAKKRIAK